MWRLTLALLVARVLSLSSRSYHFLEANPGGVHVQSLASHMDVLVRSFCVVSVAEVFDKTWFVALICALNYGPKIAFTSGAPSEPFRGLKS